MPDHDITVNVFGIVNVANGSVTYILSSRDCQGAVVIDPGGDDIKPIADYLSTRRAGIEFIALTHEHYDHIAGVESLRTEYRCPVVASRACSLAIADPKRNLSRYRQDTKDISCRPADLVFDEHFERPWGPGKVRFHATPGHSPGSACISIKNCLFTGDTLLPGGKAVTKLPGGDKTKWKQSIRFLCNHFAPDTIVYPGHGEPFALRDIQHISAPLLDAVSDVDQTEALF